MGWLFTGRIIYMKGENHLLSSKDIIHTLQFQSEIYFLKACKSLGHIVALN